MGRKLSLLQGTLEMLVLQALAAGQPRHGFEILEAISRATDEALVVEEGALYPALHRMHGRKWLEAEWGVSEKGRRAKYYTLTKAGRKALAEARDEWSRYVEAVEKVAARAAHA